MIGDDAMLGDFDGVKALEEAHQLPTYGKYEIAVERGAGAWLYDTAGKRYLDFYGGHCVTTTGHCHPEVVAAITAQAERLIFYSNIVYNRTRAEAAAAIMGLAPAGMSRVFLCNSGAEANETAIKAARKHTGRSGIIAMRNGFHGRTYGAMSITGFEKYRIFPPHLPGVYFADFGDLESIEAAISSARGDIAGIILEPVQSMAGVHLAPFEYYRELRALCDRHGIVLIFDEVQTGFGRTGGHFFSQTAGVTPDLITCAKGIASGVPMGATIFSEALARRVQLSEHGSTFGGSPLACAAAAASINIIRRDELGARARELGSWLASAIAAAQLPGFREVRGIGLLIGVEFSGEAKKLVAAMLKRGVIVGAAEDKHTIRLIPPLIIERPECELLLTTLAAASTEVCSTTEKP